MKPDTDNPEYSVYREEDVESWPDVAPTPSARGVLLLLFIVLVVVSLLAGLVSVASRWKNDVIVRGFVLDGTSLVADNELLLRIIKFKGCNLLELDTAGLKKQVMSIPYIRDAVITRELNGIVRIRVKEREPVALTFIDNKATVIDREGFLLPWRKQVSLKFPKLFTVGGASRLKTAGNGLLQLDSRDTALVLQFLQALSETDYASMLVRELHLEPDNTTWCMAVESPARFIVGNDGNFKEKLKKFEIFWQKVISKKGFAFYDTVDLRFRERIFTRDLVSPGVPQNVSR